MSTYFWTSTSSTDPSVGANWTKSDGTTGTAPTTGDDVVVTAVPGSTLANIGASDMHLVTLNSLTINQSFTGTIGAAGVGGYWQISATTLNIGTPGAGLNGNVGSGRIKIDLGTAASTINVYQTGDSTDTGYEAVRIKGSNASNVLNMMSAGSTGIGTNQPGETATVATVNVTGTNAVCNLGAGVTWTNANVASGGALTTNSGSSGTLSVAANSTATLYGTAKVTNINTSGTVTHNVRPAAGNGSDTVNVYSGGGIDYSGDPANVTIGTTNAYANSAIRRSPANPGHLTMTAFNMIEAGTLAIGA